MISTKFHAGGVIHFADNGWHHVFANHSSNRAQVKSRPTLLYVILFPTNNESADIPWLNNLFNLRARNHY
jgi:hypothetical protein